MPKINNLAAVKRTINRSMILIFFIIFSISGLGFFYTHLKFLEHEHQSDYQQIQFTRELYKSNMSEKLSILASSLVFLDYLRSGEQTRNRLYPTLLSQLASLKANSIVGMEILDDNNTNLFEYGEKREISITLNLCYLNQTLDSELGECKYKWKLFIDPNSLINELKSINPLISFCSDCKETPLLDKEVFGSFPVSDVQSFNVKLALNKSKNNIIYIYLIIMSLTLSLFAIWNWYRLSNILNKHISSPLKYLTFSLEHNESLIAKDDFIDEIRYLAHEIQTWKENLNRIQNQENAIKLGKLAAQFAHDIRSPIAALEITFKKLTELQGDVKNIVRNSLQRISDIANNLLTEYKAPIVDKSSIIQPEHIASLLEVIISEKRIQYNDRLITFNLNIESKAWKDFILINASEYKRMISNLINNAVEAITDTGNITINLIHNNNDIRIEIIDSGIGIPKSILPKILEGGISIGKKHGSGLGLSHAIKCIESWNGSYDILSYPNEGTNIGIIFPLAKPALWFLSELIISAESTLVVLDDEELIHNFWDERIDQLSSDKTVKVEHFYNSKLFVDFVKKHGSEKIIFLIDYDIGLNQANGIELITALDLSPNAILVTNRYDDIEIRNSCLNLGIKIIPKNFIPHIEIRLY